MAVRASGESLDARVARLAAVQHGVFARSQVVAEGATRGFIEGRLATGRWEPRYPGVYVMAGAPASWRQRLLAACLLTGAVASHRAAAAVLRVPGGETGTLELSAADGRRVRRSGLVVHQVASLDPVDVTVVDAIPVTTATRTIIDLAAVVTAEILEEALDDGLRRQLTSIPRLAWRIATLGRRGRPGIAVLQRLIAARGGARPTPESALETRLLRRLRRAGLPEPECQYEIKDRGRLLARVDFAFPDARVAIEADGYRWHSGRVRWERDLARRNRLTAHGWRVIHVTSGDLEHRPDEIVRMIAQALDGSPESPHGAQTGKGPPKRSPP